MIIVLLFLIYHRIGVPFGHDFLLTQRSMLIEPPRYLKHVMLKKRSTDKTIKKGPKKKIQGLRRVMECLFLCKDGAKSVCLSYLIVIMRK